MINLPKTCEVNKILPKKVFYEKANISSSIKEEFVDKVEKIYWKYKISESNINISKTDKIEEIQVFEITLKEKNEIKNVIRVITKSIPYPILFKLMCKEDYIYVIKFEEYILYSIWNEDIDFQIKGFDLAEVYNNIVRQITKLDDTKKELKEDIDKLKQIQELEKQIAIAENKMHKEKQFNIKVECNKQLMELRNKLEELK